MITWYNKETRNKDGEFYGLSTVDKPVDWDNNKNNFTKVPPAQEIIDNKIPCDWDEAASHWSTDAPDSIKAKQKLNAKKREADIRKGVKLGSLPLVINDTVINRLNFAKTALLLDNTKVFNWKFTGGWGTVNKDNVDAIILAISQHIEAQFDLNKQADEAL